VPPKMNDFSVCVVLLCLCVVSFACFPFVFAVEGDAEKGLSSSKPSPWSETVRDGDGTLHDGETFPQTRTDSLFPAFDRDAFLRETAPLFPITLAKNRGTSGLSLVISLLSESYGIVLTYLIACFAFPRHRKELFGVFVACFLGLLFGPRTFVNYVCASFPHSTLARALGKKRRSL
jgi:hypothetical protein